MKKIFLVYPFLMLSTVIFAQDHDGCDKCDMLREECEVSVSPHKEDVCAYFRKECLQTDTMFVTESGKVAAPAVATTVKVVSKGKCIDYKEVNEFEKATKKEIRSYSVVKNDTVYTVASEQPVFPGGDEALVKYLSKSIQYPASAKANKKQGTVYIKFVITRNGQVSSVKPLRSPDQELAKEAVRVVKAMPSWTPAKYKNQPVSMVFILPVKFKLN